MRVEEFVVTSKYNKITTNCSHLDKNFKNYQTRLTFNYFTSQSNLTVVNT